jgi:hypothetical protein
LIFSDAPTDARASSPAAGSTASQPETIRYLVLSVGKWRYQPTAAMKARGFKFFTLTHDQTSTEAAKAKARALSAELDAIQQVASKPNLAIPAPAIAACAQWRCGNRRARSTTQQTSQRSAEWMRRDCWDVRG